MSSELPPLSRASSELLYDNSKMILNFGFSSISFYATPFYPSNAFTLKQKELFQQRSFKTSFFIDMMLLTQIPTLKILLAANQMVWSIQFLQVVLKYDAVLAILLFFLFILGLWFGWGFALFH